MYRNFLSTAVLTSAGLVGVQATEPQKPNVICILVDDLGYGDLSCYGARDIRTPHIDRLMNEGMRFTDFYANSTVSSPSRAALLTGCFPDRVGVPGVIRTHENDSWGYLLPDAVLLPQVLKSQGYHSAIIGKWHLGLETPNTPPERGFDYFKGFLGDMMDDYYTHLRWGNNYMRQGNKTIDPQGHATDLFTDWAIDYIRERSATNGQPFFLYLAYNAPHVPLHPPTEWLERVKKREPGISEKRGKLAALIEHLDDGVGRLMASLEQQEMLENTLVIFASDNGGQADAQASNGILRGAKGDMYEGGIRVCAGFYWKGTIPAGVVTSNFAMLSDIFPTVCDLTGADIPATLDGISIRPTLQGQQQITDDRTVHWMRREGNMRYGGMCYYATRYKDHKIVQNTPWEPVQLFHITEDVRETTPLETKGNKIYESLFKQQMEHIRLAGAIPWSKPE